MPTHQRYPPLSTVYPPLILGTATFNYQYTDPAALPATAIVSRALSLGIRAFDTSPYYGPSETLLGTALTTPSISSRHPRTTYFLVTKAGRVSANQFDYSAPGIRASVHRSLQRLGTTYLDLVYCHDAEFVTPADVLTAVCTLRALRDEGLIRYIGISGFPVASLASLAAYIQRETGDPLDAVLSYGHFCVQNTQLASAAVLTAFRAAGVSVLANASILNMSLLTTRGVNAGPQAVWHPAPDALRTACQELSTVSQKHSLSLEEVAIRYAISKWSLLGAEFGTTYRSSMERRTDNIGITVIGVTRVEELEETVRIWRDVDGGSEEGRKRSEQVENIVEKEMWTALGKWKDFAWKSPEDGFVNMFSRS